MIYIGYSDREKQSIISQYEIEHSITKLVVLYPAFSPLPIEHADAIEYAEIIMYRSFYRLLQEINEQTLVVVNECLRTQNRYDLTYNCIRTFLNQTHHQLVFQQLPQIDAVEDFMILFDFVTRSQWKRESFNAKLVRQRAKVSVNPLTLNFTPIPVSTSEKTRQKYESEKQKLFDSLADKDPHTLPRNLYLIGGTDKAKLIDPVKYYVARNQRLKMPNITTYDDARPEDAPYTVVELPHRFIDFSDFIKRTGQTKFDVLTADIKVDGWYLERYHSWKERINATYASLQ